jgi:prepilin-type N-terminal cleavage/methylation domain-containing protein
VPDIEKSRQMIRGWIVLKSVKTPAGMRRTGTLVDQLRWDAGFSLVEISMVLLILCVVAGIAILNGSSILPRIGADGAMLQTVAQMRRGRETALAQRRNIRIEFVNPNQIRLVRYEVPSGTTVISTITLDGKNEFLRFDGLPDTPDAFGNGAAISFGGCAPWIFLSDGLLVDASANPVNGTIFLGQSGHPETARAVTILGATGRVRDYKWNGTSWFH